MAVWLQLLENQGLPEGSGPEVQGKVTALLDLVNCFENVRLHHVWRWGLCWKVPPRLLRMICVTYAVARRIQYHGSLSTEVSTVTAIVPGSPLRPTHRQVAH